MKQETRIFLYDLLSENLMDLTSEFISMQREPYKPEYRKILQSKMIRIQELLVELIDDGEFK